MKCVNCGHEIEDGSGFCPECGMIMSLESGTEKIQNKEKTDKKNKDGIDDDFMAYLYEDEEEKETKPQELEADKTEQIVPVEEYTIDLPQEEADTQIDNGEASYEADDVSDNGETNETMEFEDINSYSDESTSSESEAAQMQEERVVLSEPSFESLSQEDDEDDRFDDDAIDMYVKSKNKKGSILVAILVVILVCVVAAGVNLLKDNGMLPTFLQKETSVSSEESTSEITKEETTDKETTEEETTEEETTEEETTEEETTEAETTEEETTDVSLEQSTTEERSTTASETTKEQAVASTTKAPTTVPSTTKAPATTKAPTTTKVPTTAASSTTKANTTTDKYGISDAKVQAPKSYITAYTGYVTVNGVILRAKPENNGERVLYLSVGADLKVMAKENGFLYVRSNRYGVYGWVLESYVSKERTQAENQVTVPNLVKPDKTYETSSVKYVNTAEGLRLRKGPGSEYDVIRVIANGYPLEVKGYKSGVSGWVYVTDTIHGVSGWVSTAYIK